MSMFMTDLRMAILLSQLYTKREAQIKFLASERDFELFVQFGIII